MFNIQDIFIKRSPIHPNAWVLHLEMNGYQFSGYFDTWPSFMTCIRECAAFFAFKAGKMTKSQADKSLTRGIEG